MVKSCIYTKPRTKLVLQKSAWKCFFLTCLVPPVECCHVVTCDVLGAFMQADIDELLHLKLEGENAKLPI